jgi:hypothetical protein
MNAYASRWMVVEAVYQATALSGGAYAGRIVKVGTLQAGPAGLQYAPQPTDRLVVRLGEQTHEFVIHEAQGNAMAPDAGSWLMSPHILRYRHSIPEQAEADLSVRYDGQSFETGVKGWYVHGGVRYQIDLTATGGSTSVRDFHGEEVGTQYDMAGKVLGGEIEVDVSERHGFQMVAATSTKFLLPGRRGMASQFVGTLNNRLRIGDDEFSFRQVLVETGMKAKGGQGQAGLTRLEGAVLRNGEPFGSCTVQGGRAVLVTEAGSLELDAPPAIP